MDSRKRNRLKELTAYEILKTEPLPDIHAEGILLRHRKSGAKVMLIPCADSNKVFNIAFRTPPTDSTGAAHIVEHTVLCGSRSYGLKDPFVELAKGSLNTFLNAMTYPDKTMYPVASTNDADFRNLMHVYLDAVFYPNIYRDEKIFRQEGWNYQLEKPEDPLQVNGVVYNEMKGVFSSADEMLDRETFNTLFPDTPYGVESGGDPDVIPTLTYEKFLDFHRRYYHPSNSYLYLYGDMDMAETLDWIDQNYLRDFDAVAVDSAIPAQKPFAEMAEDIAAYPIADDEPENENTYLSYSVVSGDPLDIKENIAFDILDYALFSSPGAPVRQALLDAHIGKDVFGEYNDGILQPYFSIVAKGADLSDRDAFLKTVKKELKKQVKEGIRKKTLLAGINYLEFQFREADYSTYPKGLMYSIDVFDTWLYDDRHPFTALKQIAAYKALRREAEKKPDEGKSTPGYFENLIAEKILKNTHSAFVAVVPEKGLAKKKEQALEKKLAACKASLSEKQIADLIRKTRELRAFQEKPESARALASLPVLKRSDISRKGRELSNIVRRPDDVKTVFHRTETNGIGYLTLLFDAGCISEEELPYLAFLKSAMGYVDTEKYTYQQLFDEICVSTGGISCGISVFDDPKNPEGYRAYFGIRMKALYGKMNAGFALIKEIMKNSDFSDRKRLYEILSQGKMQLQMSLMQAGHTAAAGRAKAYYSSSAAFQDETAGIGYYRHLKALDEAYAKKSAALTAHLEELKKKLFTKKNLIVSYTAEEEGWEKFEKPFLRFVKALPEGEKGGRRFCMAPLGTRREGFRTAGQVQYVAEAGDFAKGGFAYTGALRVLRQMLSYDYLWQNIRVQGGAYGCGANFSREGDAVFSSYRDPNLARTVSVYENLPAYLKNFKANQAAMTKFVIGTISTMDTPLTPSLFDTVCMQAYMNGLKKKEIQKTRDEVLDVTAADIRKLSPLIACALEDRNICVIGSEGAIEKDHELFGSIETLL